MDIWTERLQREHLALLKDWLGRDTGVLTTNDLPSKTEDIDHWYERCAADPNRTDCLVSIYETPVGLAGLQRQAGRKDTVSLYLLLGEVNYNPLRTATHVTLRMLDRAFSECGVSHATICVLSSQAWFLEPLERMGFMRTCVQDDHVVLSVEKESFQSRKYLF